MCGQGQNAPEVIVVGGIGIAFEQVPNAPEQSTRNYDGEWHQIWRNSW
ncbi:MULTISPECIES: hypothetical protein [Candidatus Ichthyocystis]|nr:MULTISPECIES: hypothetical protein [Ichthyocystis]